MRKNIKVAGVGAKTMNHEIENFKSSQISPNFEVHKNSKVLSGLYIR